MFTRIMSVLGDWGMIAWVVVLAVAVWWTTWRVPRPQPGRRLPARRYPPEVRRALAWGVLAAVGLAVVALGVVLVLQSP